MTERPAEQNETDDVALIRRYVEQGDRDALAEFFQRYSDFAYRMACRVLRNPSDAEDAVQAAFVLIMRNARKYRGGSGWVAQIVVNVSREMIRKSVRRRGREEKYMAETPADESYETIADSGDDQAQLVKNLLDQLPEKYRIPVWLRHYEGLAFHVVAKTLRLPEGTVRSQVSRGVDLLRKTLEQRSAAMPAASLLGLLAALPAESAPSTMPSMIHSIVEGAGSAGNAGSSVLRTTHRSLKRFPAWLKPTLVATAVVGSVGVWRLANLSQSHNDTTPLPSPATGGMSFPFYDNFEEGLGQWEIERGDWSIAPGKGVQGGDCLQVRLNMDGTVNPMERHRLWARCPPLSARNFEVRFKVLQPNPADVFFGLSIEGRQLIWTALEGKYRGRDKQLLWQEYRIAVIDNEYELTIATKQPDRDSIVKQQKGSASYLRGGKEDGRLNITASALAPNAIMYFDDFEARLLEP